MNCPYAQRTQSSTLDIGRCGTTSPNAPLPATAPFLLAVLLAAAACGSPPLPASAPRDPRWAEPIARQGLPNLARIEPDLYRGAQPEPAGFIALRDLGVKTVVNLRALPSDRDRIRAAGLPEDAFEVIEIPMRASQPDLEKTRAFLAVAINPQRRPLLFHCWHGADRTGAMAAAYRIAVQGWAPGDAVDEMISGGFGFHPVFRRLPEFLAALPTAQLRAELGLR